MNVEPLKKRYDELLLARPGQININKAISNYTGKAEFHIVSDCDGHSSLKENINNSKAKVENITVDVDTLDNIFAEHSISNVDFLKIDVEGAEAEVISSLNLKKHIPKIIILESVPPVEHFGFLSFEDFVVGNDYIFAMTDDLNRYYVRKESKEEFKEKFRFINSCVRYDKLARGAECYSKYKCSF